MWLTALLIPGIIIGFMASVPLGPIGVLCIQRTLSKNQKAGFVSGLGAATSDVIFASAAFFSLSVVVSFIETHMLIIRIIGGACVVAVGISIFFKNPVVQMRRNRSGAERLWPDFVSMFLITLANPTFILIFIALFAAAGISSAELSILDGLTAILGVFLGGAAWWFALTFVVNLFRKRFRPRHLLWINRIAGAAIVILGMVVIFVKSVSHGMAP
ncbi:MAG: LysE family translocator [Rikenellaceae bacterium]|jgi:threonine/homoserine/homoserine lactone efflux protein|nr:LysE family translocator [Rikenellaceae bacterium]